MARCSRVTIASRRRRSLRRMLSTASSPQCRCSSRYSAMPTVCGFNEAIHQIFYTSSWMARR